MAARERVKAAADAWIRAGWFVVVEDRDSERKLRRFVVVGAPAKPLSEALVENLMGAIAEKRGGDAET